MTPLSMSPLDNILTYSAGPKFDVTCEAVNTVLEVKYFAFERFISKICEVSSISIGSSSFRSFLTF